MATLPKESSFTPAPAGPHPAICYRVIDMGTQDISYKGNTERKHQVMLSWELFCDERMEDGRRFTINKYYNWTMGQKASLRLHLELWRGKPFAKTDFGPGGFDIKNLIGAACLLNIVPHEKQNGDVGSKIEGVMKLPRGMSVGKLENPTLYLWLSHDEFDKDAFMSLSDKMREAISKAPEYKAAITGEDVETKPLWAGPAEGEEDLDPPF